MIPVGVTGIFVILLEFLRILAFIDVDQFNQLGEQLRCSSGVEGAMLVVSLVNFVVTCDSKCLEGRLMIRGQWGVLVW